MTSKNHSKNFIYLAILLIPFLIMVANPSLMLSLKDPMMSSQSLPIKILTWPIYEIKKLILYRYTHDEYIRLKKDNDTLRARLAGLEEVSRENSRFENLFNLNRKLVYSTTAAVVVGRDPTNWNASLIVNKGHDHGIDVGMPVINHLGVVGKVVEVMPKRSRVILITDPSFSVAGLIQRPRESGLLSGTLRQVCRIRYLPENASVKVGDKVITSKLSQAFPEGLLIGEVINVYHNKQARTKECLVKPAVELSKIEEVLIIK